MKEKGINYKLIFQNEKEITFPDIEKMQQFIASRAALLELLLVEEKWHSMQFVSTNGKMHTR